jgi:hypothetical protein
VIALPPLLVGAVKATIAEAFPAVAVTLVGAPDTVVATHGTPGQFSNAAFFQRTLISSRLKGDFLFISTFPDSFMPLLTGLPSLGVICPKHINGTIIINRILTIILRLFSVSSKNSLF